MLPEIASKKGQVGEAEWQARCDLAACYRLAAHYGWTHLIHNHISLRIPGAPDQFLLNPYGLLYEQVTASSLVKIDFDGNLLEETPYGVNRSGFVIHSAIHMARPDLHCVFHTHTVAGQAVSALNCGILPLNQTAMRFYNRVSSHAYEGVSHDLDERERLIRDLGPENKVLLLKNHGMLTAGANVAEAFNLMYYLEKTCQTQMQVLSAQEPYSLPSEQAVLKSAEIFHRGNAIMGQRDWPALVALVDKLYPDYAA